MGRKSALSRLLYPLGFGVHRLGSDHLETRLVEACQEFKRHALLKLADSHSFMVKRGPFEGMVLPKGGAWSDYDLFSKIIGSYERELFPIIEEAIKWKPDVILNVGASDGYYAVGLKSRAPSALVVAYDIDIRSRAVLEACATQNSVAVTSLSEFDFAAPKILIEGPNSNGRNLLFIDCEGCEIGISNIPRQISDRTFFIVELHDHIVPGLTDRLLDFLNCSHNVTIIPQTTRKVENFPELAEFSPLAGAILLDEFRAVRMSWLVAVPK